MEMYMNFIRIQDKIISWQRIENTLRKILQLRARGLSQQEVADRLLIDRTFISRLESIGELRKGQTIACIGFPVINKLEIEKILEDGGVDFIFLMTEQERLDFVNRYSGKELLNEIMNLVSRIRKYEVVICLCSDERIKLIKGILDAEVISVELGHSPITEDKWVDPKVIKEILIAIKSAR
jgi:transcriptional regulator with XRE-family HTH domain